MEDILKQILSEIKDLKQGQNDIKSEVKDLKYGQNEIMGELEYIRETVTEINDHRKRIQELEDRQGATESDIRRIQKAK